MNCTHPEVKAYADPLDYTKSWAMCTFCESDLTRVWWRIRDALRHEFVLVRGGSVELHMRNEAYEPDAYRRYVAACEDENLEAHTLHMWRIHGRPEGPLGGAS